MNSEKMTKPQKEQVMNLLTEFSDIFSETPNLTHVAAHKIDTGDSLPIHSPHIRFHKNLRKKQTEKLRNCWKWV